MNLGLLLFPYNPRNSVVSNFMVGPLFSTHNFLRKSETCFKEIGVGSYPQGIEYRRVGIHVGLSSFSCNLGHSGKVFMIL